MNAPEGYDPNHVFPVKQLENDRIKLTFFVPELHSQAFFDAVKDHPENWEYWMQGPYETVEAFSQEYVEEIMHKDSSKVLFAIIDKTKSTPTVAGCIALLFSDVLYQSTAIGYIMILPSFQRTHVLSNAVGLLLHYCLELPSSVLSSPQVAESLSENQKRQRFGPGLGLRRVQWQAHSDNEPSVKAARRLGFQLEGIIRWDRILRTDKAGSKIAPERALVNAGIGRHCTRLAICWDDWDDGGIREVVQGQMDRR